jgi:hypothetical protein
MWSYAASYAVLDGLRAHGVEVVVVPSLRRASDRTSNPWVETAQELLKGERFDQVWVWITHSHYPQSFWEWINELAPVRVGVLMESLRYTEQDIRDWGELAGSFDRVAEQLRHMSHVLSYDECDVAEISDKLGIAARLFHLMLPAELINHVHVPGGQKMIFLGTVYDKRQRFLEREGLTDLLEISGNRMSGPETKLGLDVLFNEINARYLTLHAEGRASLAEMQEYVGELQAVRREVLLAGFGLYSRGFAMVNLPALFKSFPSRVLEAMAAGVPVITNRIVDRPKTAALFEDDRDILYYDEEVPNDLRSAAQRLRIDPALRTRIAANARNRVMQELTSEAQLAGILAWVAATPPRESTVEG